MPHAAVFEARWNPHCAPWHRAVYPRPVTSIGPLVGVIVWTSEERFPVLRRFYVETLGLPPRTDRPRMVNFEWSGIRLTLGIHDQVDGANRDHNRIMINLGTSDLDAVHARMVTAGVPCLRPPSAEPWGGRVATYQDPDGNVVQLLELASTQ